MGSAKVTIRQQDRTLTIPSLSSVYGGIAIRANKGKIGEPFLVTGEDELIDNFGEPLLASTGYYSAMTYLGESNKLWVVRAAHEDVKYSVALVRSKVSNIPTDPIIDGYIPDPIVKPLDGGMTQEELDSYIFPLYSTDRIYELAENTIFANADDTTKVRLNNLDGLKVGDKLVFNTGDINSLNNDNIAYGIVDLYTQDLTYDKITVDTAISGGEGVEVFKDDGEGNLTAYPNHPKVVRDFTSSKEILVDNADYIANGDLISIGGATATFESKEVYQEVGSFVELDNKVTLTKDYKVYKILQDKMEDRDAFLVASANQGKWGNKISIGIAPAKDDIELGAFLVLVYYDGVQVETWKVSRKQVINGNGDQLYLEDVINGKSKYILVKNNVADVSYIDGEPELPLFTNYSLWLQNPTDLFQKQSITLEENLLQGHTEVKLNSVAGLAVGNRIKFEIDINDKLSSEYKILSIDSNNNTIILDRPIVEVEINKEIIDENGSTYTASLYKFDDTVTDLANGIKNGVQYYPLTKLDKVYYNYPMGVSFSISGIDGKLVDAGANLMKGGDDGSPVTVSDMVNAIKLLSNREETPVTLLLDGGYTVPAYAQALYEVAKNHDLTHVYLSSDINAELSANYKNEIVDYKASLNLNTEKASVFTGWLKVLDEYNQKELYIAPDGFAAASQVFTTDNYAMWYPAAGWKRGKIVALDITRKFSEGDRDWFVDNRINPIRYKKGSGLVIWGNETLISNPSPLQLRSVAMLLIYIKYGLYEALENVEFDLNDETTWSLVEGSIDGFMRDDVQAKRGVYSYRVAVKDVITDTDIANRRMPVFLGIQPTMDIKEIPVTLAIYNKGQKIEVSV